jgi:hypothetical protein
VKGPINGEKCATGWAEYDHTNPHMNRGLEENAEQSEHLNVIR